MASERRPCREPAKDTKEKTPIVRLPRPSTTDLRGRPPAVRARDCGEGRVGEQLVRHGAAVALAAERAVGLGRDPLARAQREQRRARVERVDLPP